MAVPVDRADPAAGSVDLAVTRRPAARPAQRVGSLVVNPGGPGSSAVDYLRRAWQAVPEAVRARFDLVAFDPRGVGASAPLRCVPTEQMDALVALDPTPDDDAELRALRDGNRTLAAACERSAGALLPHVSTEQAARDLDVLRSSLGDPGLTYLGYSYGTAIGVEHLRLFPERVRAMVLDSPLDPSLSWEQVLEGQAGGFDVALGAFLDDCARAGCAFSRALPRDRRGDLYAAFDALAAQVETQPLPTGGPRTVGPGEFSLGVGAGLYSRASGWPAVAEGLAAAVRGDGSVLLALSDAYLDRTDEGYRGTSEANLAVNCIDRPWPREPEPYLALAERVAATAPRFGPAIALSGLACADWPVPPVRTPSAVQVEGAPPVLVLATTRDPATPYAWAQRLVGQLAPSSLVTVDGDGHTVYRSTASRCVRDAVDTYLLTQALPAATTC
jgi:pimeloyl-ACP methyl ester carboxylesterase